MKPFLKDFYIPSPDSHKGQNGKVLIIGGSSLFHSASLWAAEVATHFVDMVHYSSTSENNKLFLDAKKKFQNGIVVTSENIPEYVREDDVTLIGPGMVRGTVSGRDNPWVVPTDEPSYARYLTHKLLTDFPHKKFVIDAGALQMMERDWLLQLTEKPIVTPHQLEFEGLFGIAVKDLSREEKITIVTDTAKKYHCIILLKAVIDIISDGETTYVVEGGNQGLTKGGSGDTLAGLCTSFYAKNNGMLSAVLASCFLKKTADELFKSKGLYYNTADLIAQLPYIVAQFTL